MFMKVKLTNTLNAIAGRKPTIDRINERDFNKKGKYYVGPSSKGNFLQVNDGLHIRYYDNPFPVFHNLYRIVSKNGNDFVVHEARR